MGPADRSGCADLLRGSEIVQGTQLTTVEDVRQTLGGQDEIASRWLSQMCVCRGAPFVNGARLEDHSEVQPAAASQ